MPQREGSLSRDDRVNEVIALYVQRAERGEALTPAQFLAEHPDLVQELKSFFADQMQFRQIAGDLILHVAPAHETLGSIARTPAAVEDDTLRTGRHPENPSLANGRRHFGEYELLEEIARGGMGVVYKARQVMLNRIVAVKMILGGQLAGPEDVQRFHTEAEAAAQLDHPGIVPIYEVGEQDGQHYFSMGFVEGPSLAKRIAEGPLEPRVAAEIVKAIAEAVQYAHDKGVIHRDLKPGNVLLDMHGNPRVTDFGLAKLTESRSNLTGTGQILGTPSYMPPEQASGQMHAVGRHSDIYSLGAILYCLLTGRTPFQAASPIETLRQVVEQDPVPPRLLNPSVPRDLETICLMCLRKEISKRYASAADLRDDLMRFLAGEPIRARRVGAGERALKWIKRRPAVAAMIAVTIVAIFGSSAVIALIRAEAANQEAITVVAAYLRAPPAAVPYAMKDLVPFRRLTVPLLRAKLEDNASNDADRLRAACGLTELGDRPLEFLLEVVPRVPVAECANLIAALEHMKPAAVPELVRRADAATDSGDKARYAILALHFGNAKAARDALALRADPTHRTSLIQTFGNWHGHLGIVAELLRNEQDEAFRSGLCAALGSVAPQSTEIGALDAATRILQELYVRAPDAGTHSAAGWALRLWKRKVPAIEETPAAPAERRWFVNGQGMAMIEISPGAFEMGNTQAEIDELCRSIPFDNYQVTFRKSAPRHLVRLTKGFYLGACEVTQQQFQDLMGVDGSYFSPRGPGRAYVADRETSQQPVEQVGWFHAIEFCNRLSDKEGLPRYYQRQSLTVRVLGGIGYRLPTEAEWEFACRAGTTTRWSFGDNRQDLEKHAWIRINAGGIPHPVGELCPNSYGLHDLYGNALEWCWDYDAGYSSDPMSDPVGPPFGTERVLRGNHFENDWFGATSGYRAAVSASERPSYGRWFGFRVAKTVDAAGAADTRKTPTFSDQQTSRLTQSQAKVPNSFSFDLSSKISDPEPGRRIWTRIDDQTFSECLPSGLENRLKILGRIAVAGVDGTLVEKIGFERVQVFIPDCGNEKMEIKFRFAERPDVWVLLGAMERVE